MKAILFIGFLLVLGLQGCAGSSSGSGSAGDGSQGTQDSPEIKAANDKCANTPVEPGTDMRYSMSENINGNSCTTGCQIFHSAQAYCSGLQDSTLNHGCATEQRQKEYQADCAN